MNSIRHEQRFINKAITGVIVKPRIHKIHLSTYHPYQKILKLGTPNIDENYSNNTDKEMGYKRKSFIQTKSEKITLYSDRIGKGPPFMLVLKSPSFGLLLDINNALPSIYPEIENNYKKCIRGEAVTLPRDYPKKVTISVIEYTLDLMCGDPLAVAELFYILRRHMYLGACESTILQGGHFGGWPYEIDKNFRTTNCLWKVFYRSHRKYFKMYERGLDSNSNRESGWSHDLVNRVRLEFTFKWNYLTAREFFSLNSLIINPSFTDLLFKGPLNKRSDLIRFCGFKSHGELPRWYDEYTTEDKKGNAYCFQEEVLAHKNDIKNLSQYIEDLPAFNGFKNKIKTATRKFDKKWEKKMKTIAKRKQIIIPDESLHPIIKILIKQTKNL